MAWLSCVNACLLINLSEALNLGASHPDILFPSLQENPAARRPDPGGAGQGEGAGQVGGGGEGACWQSGGEGA